MKRHVIIQKVYLLLFYLNEEPLSDETLGVGGGTPFYQFGKQIQTNTINQW